MNLSIPRGALIASAGIAAIAAVATLYLADPPQGRVAEKSPGARLATNAVEAPAAVAHGERTTSAAAKTRPGSTAVNEQVLDRLRSLTIAVGQLRDEVDALRQAQQEQAVDPNMGLADVPYPEAEEDRRRQRQQEQLAVFDSTLDVEPSDPAWSPEAEQQIEFGLRSAPEGVHVNELSCAHSLCRVDMELGEEVDPNELFRAVDTHLAWEGEVFLTADSDTGMAQLYLARPDYPLPRIDSDY